MAPFDPFDLGINRSNPFEKYKHEISCGLKKKNIWGCPSWVMQNVSAYHKKRTWRRKIITTSWKINASNTNQRLTWFWIVHLVKIYGCTLTPSEQLFIYIMSVKSSLGLVLYCYLIMPTINKTYLILWREIFTCWWDDDVRLY